MKKIFIATLLFTFGWSIMTKAQNKPIIKFDKTEHDMGIIAEEGGKIKYRFIFSNAGNDTLKIIMVRPSCNCITVDYTKTAIKESKKGFIDIDFDPMNCPGDFFHTINITTNDPLQPVINLKVKGKVSPKPKTYKDLYPAVIGHLRLAKAQFSFNNVNTTATKKDTIIIYNDWHSAMKLSTKDVAQNFTITLVPEVLQPKKTGLVIITYDVSKKQEFGYIYDRFFLATNDSLLPDKNIGISMNIVEDFSKLTPEQLANAPKISFQSTKCDFKTIKEGAEAPCEFVFTNTGKSDLIIRKVKASCGCTATNPEKTLLKPGESSKINATFNSTGKPGHQTKTINVISNDPTNSNIMLIIEGTVEKVVVNQ